MMGLFVFFLMCMQRIVAVCNLGGVGVDIRAGNKTMQDFPAKLYK